MTPRTCQNCPAPLSPATRGPWCPRCAPGARFRRDGIAHDVLPCATCGDWLALRLDIPVGYPRCRTCRTGARS